MPDAAAVGFDPTPTSVANAVRPTSRPAMRKAAMRAFALRRGYMRLWLYIGRCWSCWRADQGFAGFVAGASGAKFACDSLPSSFPADQTYTAPSWQPANSVLPSDVAARQ